MLLKSVQKDEFLALVPQVMCRPNEYRTHWVNLQRRRLTTRPDVAVARKRCYALTGRVPSSPSSLASVGQLLSLPSRATKPTCPARRPGRDGQCYFSQFLFAVHRLFSSRAAGFWEFPWYYVDTVGIPTVFSAGIGWIWRLKSHISTAVSALFISQRRIYSVAKLYYVRFCTEIFPCLRLIN